MNSTQSKLLEISADLQIGCTQSGDWLVIAKNGTYPLKEVRDFWRVVILLERTYVDVKSMFDKYVEASGLTTSFPYWKLVGAGLEFKTEQWASLALNWVPELASQELVALKGALENIANSKWASQKSRQLANKFAKRATPPH